MIVRIEIKLLGDRIIVIYVQKFILEEHLRNHNKSEAHLITAAAAEKINKEEKS